MQEYLKVGEPKHDITKFCSSFFCKLSRNSYGNEKIIRERKLMQRKTVYIHENPN